MKNPLTSLAALAALASPLAAQDAQEDAPSPNQIAEQAPAEEWKAIEAEDLLVMTLAPDAEGNERKVIIQLMPAPFSEAWTANIRTFARSGWYDNITVNRVQDNYVVQWGDANYDNPDANGEPKGLPEGLIETDEDAYSATDLLEVPQPRRRPSINYHLGGMIMRNAMIASGDQMPVPDEVPPTDEYLAKLKDFKPQVGDNYGNFASIGKGWPVSGELSEEENRFWPVHCYGMVGVGRNLSPDAGTGAELYTVIGHAPRHLDRNIALVGRIVEGIEHLSSLPRGKGALGFYEDASKRTPILTVRVASDLSESERPAFEYLDTEGQTFARYAEARANRRDPFFIHPAGGADICNIPVPVRRVAE